MQKIHNWLVLLYKSDYIHTHTYNYMHTVYLKNKLKYLSSTKSSFILFWQILHWPNYLSYSFAMNFWTIEGWSYKLSLDQKLTTTSLLYSYFSVLHTGWLPVAEAEKKKVKTPKNVLRLHKSRLALFSLNLYLLRSSSLPHQKMLLKTTTSLSASLSTRQDSERFLKRPPKNSLWRNAISSGLTAFSL